MAREILYMFGIVAVGFAVNYALRALPFLLFAGRDRPLPRWVERFGGIVSPVIIGCLVVYSYACLSWRTPAPFVAGAVTVLIHLWRRNALVSILAGTIVYMCLLAAGCTTSRTVDLDARHPTISVKTTGVYIGEERVAPEEVPEILRDAEIQQDRTVHILLDGAVRDLTEAHNLMGMIAAAGYTRPVLVTKQHGATASRAGKFYTEKDLQRTDDDVLFFVDKTHEVRFGRLTPVKPDQVIPILKKNGIGKDREIKICGYVRDAQDEEVNAMMCHIEIILVKAGYRKRTFCWFPDPERKDGRSANTQRKGKAAIRDF